MGLFLIWRHKLLCMHVYKDLLRCKSVCDVKSGIDRCPLPARSCNRWWPDLITFTAGKKSRFGLKRGTKAQCVSNRCKDLFKRKIYFGVRCTLSFFRSPSWFVLKQSSETKPLLWQSQALELVTEVIVINFVIGSCRFSLEDLKRLALVTVPLHWCLITLFDYNFADQ